MKTPKWGLRAHLAILPHPALALDRFSCLTDEESGLKTRDVSERMSSMIPSHMCYITFRLLPNLAIVDGNCSEYLSLWLKELPRRAVDPEEEEEE